MSPTPCPCQSGLAFELCCGPRLDGSRPAETAEALMRSRYTAYTLADEAYLLASWHPSTRPASLDLAAGPPAKWLGLQIKRHVPASGAASEPALVEFVARYKIGGRAHRLHETSRFVREDGRWLYLDGDIAE